MALFESVNLKRGNRKVIWVLMFKSQIWNKNLFGGRKKSLSNLLGNVSFYYESRVSFKVQMKPCSPGLFLEEGRGGVAGEVMNLAKQDAWKTNTNCAFIHELIKICHKNYERNVLMGYGQKIREGLVILSTCWGDNYFHHLILSIPRHLYSHKLVWSRDHFHHVIMTTLPHDYHAKWFRFPYQMITYLTKRVPYSVLTLSSDYLTTWLPS